MFREKVGNLIEEKEVIVIDNSRLLFYEEK